MIWTASNSQLGSIARCHMPNTPVRHRSTHCAMPLAYKQRLGEHYSREHARHKLTSLPCVALASMGSELYSKGNVLQGTTVYGVADMAPAAPPDLWEAGPVVAVFLTHWADLGSWELTQRLVKVLPQLQAGGVQVFAVGLGSAEQGRRFAQLLGFPQELLFADPEGECHRALGYSQGFAPSARVSPYLKLLPMLTGIGSPGTLQEVIRGYIGDGSAKPVFEGASPFNILGTGYQRPFELATLRLRNMISVLSEWGALAPAREDLLTQQGGALVLGAAPERRIVFRHADRGILGTVKVDALLQAAQAAKEPQALPGA